MTAGNDERLTWQFLQWVWQYGDTRRPGIIELLRVAKADGKSVYVLRNPRAVERFLRRAANIPTG